MNIPFDLRCLCYQGDRSLLDSPTAAILNSRKPRKAAPSDRWLRTTIALTEEAVRDGFTIVSSLGMLTYDLVTFIATHLKAPTIIVLDGLLPELLPSDKQAEFHKEFAGLFDPEKTLFVSPFRPETKIPDRSERGFERDCLVVSLASRVLAGEIRSGGYMEKLALAVLKEDRYLLNSASETRFLEETWFLPASAPEILRKYANCSIRVFRPAVFDKFTAGNRTLLSAGAEEVELSNSLVEHVSRRPERPKAFPATSGNPVINPSSDLSEYLFHYTRSCYGPWPGQSRANYVRSLVDGDIDAGHTGFDTLCRILCEGIIRGSHRLVRGNVPVVSFSACPPTKLANIRKWNPALIRWTFEPYAVGICRPALKKMGACPVIYGSESKFQGLGEAERFRFQLHQPPKTDWVGEEEWRIIGDIDLSRMSPEDVVVIVSTEEDALCIQEKFSLPVISLNDTT